MCTKYNVLMVHHDVTESDPSGCRQQYFSSGRHLAAAASATLSTTLSGRQGSNLVPVRLGAPDAKGLRRNARVKLDRVSLLSTTD